MLSNKPYLIRAFYEWIVDSKCIPYITVNATYPNCKVPQNFIEDGQITLDISSIAVRDLKMGNEILEFRASFAGIVHIISVPIKAILAIYAQENGQGMFFDFEEEGNDGEAWQKSATEETLAATNEMPPPKSRASHLKLVE